MKPFLIVTNHIMKNECTLSAKLFLRSEKKLKIVPQATQLKLCIEVCSVVIKIKICTLRVRQNKLR